MQYVELSGLVGVFIRLDVDHTGEEQVETILRAAQQQVLMFLLIIFKWGRVRRGWDANKIFLNYLLM